MLPSFCFLNSLFINVTKCSAKLPTACYGHRMCHGQLLAGFGFFSWGGRGRLTSFEYGYSRCRNTTMLYMYIKEGVDRGAHLIWVRLQPLQEHYYVIHVHQGEGGGWTGGLTLSGSGYSRCRNTTMLYMYIKERVGGGQGGSSRCRNTTMLYMYIKERVGGGQGGSPYLGQATAVAGTLLCYTCTSRRGWGVGRGAHLIWVRLQPLQEHYYVVHQGEGGGWAGGLTLSG